MNSNTLRGAIAGAALLAVAVAGAQTSPNAIRLGLFFPSNGDLKAATSDSWFALGLDHNFTKGYFNVKGTSESISLDYMEKSGNRSIPVIYNLIYPGEQGLSWFFGAGGVYKKFANASDEINLAAQVGVNYDLASVKLPVFVQVKYTYTGKDDYRGLSAYLGYKF